MDKLGKGRRMERLAMDRWEIAGYKTWQPPRAKYSGQDIFDLFDFIAVRDDGLLHLVQVKRYRKDELERARKRLEAFVGAYPCPVSIYLVSWRVLARKRILMHSGRLTAGMVWVQCGSWYAD